VVLQDLDSAEVKREQRLNRLTDLLPAPRKVANSEARNELMSDSARPRLKRSTLWTLVGLIGGIFAVEAGHRLCPRG
jgi:hypothetical protein